VAELIIPLLGRRKQHQRPTRTGKNVDKKWLCETRGKGEVQKRIFIGEGGGWRIFFQEVMGKKYRLEGCKNHILLRPCP